MSVDLTDISPRAFAHPLDLQALDALDRIPMLPSILRKLSEINVEKRFRAHHMHNSIRIGPRQLGSLWRMVHQVAERFGMECPDAFVSRYGQPNAFAFGLERRSIVLTAELIDLMRDRELEAIIAHELGHVLCQHMLYKQMGLALCSGTTLALSPLIPLSQVLRKSVEMAFLGWNRAAEYSADRAALLVLQDPEALASCLSILAGLPNRLRGEFDPRQFAEQIDEYEQEVTVWSRIVTWDLGLLMSHPEATRRAAAVLEWAGSHEYREILAGRYRRISDDERDKAIHIEGVAMCHFCGHPVGEGRFCANCGEDQQVEVTQCRNGHPAAVGWKHCKACGAELEPTDPET